MKKKGVLSVLREYKAAIMLAFMGAALFFIVSMLFMRKYKSDVEMLVIQKQSNWKIDDAYSAAKSAENISTLLVHAIETTSFMDRVMASGYAIDQSILDYNLEDRKEIWNNAVKARAIKNSGIIKLSVLNKDRDKADQMASAVAYILRNKADQYHGGGDRIEVKTIDGPITSESPVSPFFGIDALLGAVIGFFIGLAIDREDIVLKSAPDKFNFVPERNDFVMQAHGFENRDFENRANAANIEAEPPMNLPFG